MEIFVDIGDLELSDDDMLDGVNDIRCRLPNTVEMRLSHPLAQALLYDSPQLPSEQFWSMWACHLLRVQM